MKAPVQEPAVENHTKPAVAAAPAQVDTRRRNKRDQIRNAMILIVKKMVQENNKGIEIVKIK